LFSRMTFEPSTAFWKITELSLSSSRLIRPKELTIGEVLMEVRHSIIAKAYLIAD
jgi:hypothetical protein